VISEREIPLADETLAPIPGSYITFLNVHRALKSGKISVFHLSTDKIVIKADEFNDIVVPVSDITAKTANILERLINAAGAFSLPEAQELMDRLNLHSVKAPSAAKADLVATIMDRSTNTSDLTGFSTKSFLGASATLFNASGATNFRYAISGITQAQAVTINQIEGRSKMRDRLAMIAKYGGSLAFTQIASPVLSANLRKIDTMLPEFVADMLLAYYQGRGTSCADLVTLIAEHSAEVKRFRLSHEDLTFKIKQLLVNVALGMVPNTQWDGMQKAHGGYLIVKRAGELVCYHAVHRDKFLQYLFIATKFDTPSTGRHHFGSIVEENGQFFINLNLQIRFK